MSTTIETSEGTKGKNSKFTHGLVVGIWVGGVIAMGVTMAGSGNSAPEPTVELVAAQVVVDEQVTAFGLQIDSILDDIGMQPNEVSLSALKPHLVDRLDLEIDDPWKTPGVQQPLSYKADENGFCLEYRYKGAVGTYNDCGTIIGDIDNGATGSTIGNDGQSITVSYQDKIARLTDDELVHVAPTLTIKKNREWVVTVELSTNMPYETYPIRLKIDAPLESEIARSTNVKFDENGKSTVIRTGKFSIDELAIYQWRLVEESGK